MLLGILFAKKHLELRGLEISVDVYIIFYVTLSCVYCVPPVHVNNKGLQI